MADETITLEFLGRSLHAIQAEQRTLRMESALLRKKIGRLASRDEVLEVLRVLADRMGNFKALIEARLDEITSKIAQSPR